MKNWYKINNSINALSIAIDDEIGAYGISAKSFIDYVQSQGSNNIELVINSGGGSVFDAFAIYDFLTTSNYNVTVKIQGLAASAATIIALAGKEKPRMTANSFFMIHNPWMGVDLYQAMEASDMRELAKDLEKQAEFMDLMTNKLAKIYDKHTSLGVDRILSMMNETTWMDAETALELGFVSGIDSAIAIAASVSSDEMEKKGFKNIPNNYVNQLNNSNMSENKSTVEELKAFISDLFAKKQEVKNEVVEQPTEEKVDIDALKEELKAELSKELESAKLEAEELKAKLSEQEVLASTSKEELELAKKEIEKAKASREPLTPRADSNDEPKNVVKDELGSTILSVFKKSGLI